MKRSFAIYILTLGLLFSQGTLMGGRLLNQELSAAELAIHHGLATLHQTETQDTLENQKDSEQ